MNLPERRLCNHPDAKIVYSERRNNEGELVMYELLVNCNEGGGCFSSDSDEAGRTYQLWDLVKEYPRVNEEVCKERRASGLCVAENFRSKRSE